MNKPIIAVFCGGTSSEREVSLGSGAACAKALAEHFTVETFDIRENALPPGLSREKHVVFSTLHGTFGEDGGMQTLLDEARVHYAGCDAASSALTMDKTRTKLAVSKNEVRVAPGLLFNAAHKLSADDIIAEIGASVVVKPNDQGSSVGLSLVSNRLQLHEAIEKITTGNWLVEQRIEGRELSVGVLEGKAMGVVEIRPKSGVYDYSSKYTKGMTEYLAPAPFDEGTTQHVRTAAERAYAACGCRDYARVDFIFSQRGLFLLEINTLPGMKETSLLPMSARVVGLDFSALVRAMVTPALQRYRADQAVLRQ
ncbi:MAG TPA: D-alanine--D-alanine ligase [Opitutaceae bacterium]|nr:D-alanine--D-alanine ligase [Opitutaceae bacterium]